MKLERFMLEPEEIEPFLQTQKAQGEANGFIQEVGAALVWRHLRSFHTNSTENN